MGTFSQWESWVVYFQVSICPYLYGLCKRNTKTGNLKQYHKNDGIALISLNLSKTEIQLFHYGTVIGPIKN